MWFWQTWILVCEFWYQNDDVECRDGVSKHLFLFVNSYYFFFQGPVNYVCLHCVKPSLRPLSMAMSTVAIHIFGDVPSAPLVGVVQVSIFRCISYNFTNLITHYCAHTIQYSDGGSMHTGSY